MKKDLVELVFILDKSGSMLSLKNDTIGSYNSLLKEQKKEKGECIVSTVLFNNKTHVLHDRVNIKDVDLLTSEDYSPCGSTSLYDSVCETVDRIGKSLSETPEDERPPKVMVVIITDGQENSSVEFTAQNTKDRIEHQKNKYNWDFNFIGANIDTKLEASKIGIDGLSAMSYTASDIGTKAVYTSLSNSISSLRSTGEYDKVTLSTDISDSLNVNETIIKSL